MCNMQQATAKCQHYQKALQKVDSAHLNVAFIKIYLLGPKYILIKKKIALCLQ